MVWPVAVSVPAGANVLVRICAHTQLALLKLAGRLNVDFRNCGLTLFWW